MNPENFITAIEEENNELIEEFMKTGFDLTYKDSGGTSPLHTAAFYGNEKVVNYYISKSANINVQNSSDFTPLQLAASRGYQHVCALLVKGGADLSLKTDNGGTALHVAAAYGHAGICSFLIDNGAGINEPDKFMCTPLQVAIGLAQKNVVELLLKRGANIEAKNVNGATALVRAVDSLITYRVDYWSIDTQNAHGKKRKYEINQGRFSYTDGGDIFDVDLASQRMLSEKSWGPKAHLQYLDTIEIIELLLSHNPNINEVDTRKQSALHKACLAGDLHVIKKLIGFNIETEALDSQGANMLHLASTSKRKDTVSFLIKEHFADQINAVDDYGYSALHYFADFGGGEDLFNELKTYGAKHDIKSTKEKGPFKPGILAHEIAAYHQDHLLEKLLMPEGN